MPQDDAISPELTGTLVALKYGWVPENDELGEVIETNIGGSPIEKVNVETLTAAEQSEYTEIVRMNDTLSLLKLQAEELSSQRVAS